VSLFFPYLFFPYLFFPVHGAGRHNLDGKSGACPGFSSVSGKMVFIGLIFRIATPC
jgi:hypothetical protein